MSADELVAFATEFLRLAAAAGELSTAMCGSGTPIELCQEATALARQSLALATKLEACAANAAPSARRD